MGRVVQYPRKYSTQLALTIQKGRYWNHIPADASGGLLVKASGPYAQIWHELRKTAVDVCVGTIDRLSRIYLNNVRFVKNLGC